jgi:hypothetical protein
MRVCLADILKKLSIEMIGDGITPIGTGSVPALQGETRPSQSQGEAKPDIKPPRRKKTLSKWDYRETMKDYMKQYRSEGKDTEIGQGYVKKSKGE